MSDAEDNFIHADKRHSPLPFPGPPHRDASRTAGSCRDAVVASERNYPAQSGADYDSNCMDDILTAAVTTGIPPQVAGQPALVPGCLPQPPFRGRLASALAPAENCLSPPSVPFPDSLDAHNSSSELLPSSPPCPLPQRRPRKAVATASTKASSAPRKRGLNSSAEQL